MDGVRLTAAIGSFAVGCALVVAACWMVTPALGVGVAGAGLVALGLVLNVGGER